MVDETITDELATIDVSIPAAASVVAGSIGTITGLRRGSVLKAIAGGVLLGTAGYMYGTIARDAIDPPGQPTGGEDVSIETTSSPTTESAAPGDTEPAADETTETDEVGDTRGDGAEEPDPETDG